MCLPEYKVDFLSSIIWILEQNHHSPSDVIHALAMPTLPIEVTVSTLYHALTTMEADSYGLMEMWTGEFLGVATEVYR